ncbi:hypothetical protein SmJEL517_g00749 [Synchytrium microbalum]|uniref:Origin recognition complex subunit 2 n=1 Tax=Synchytrium microbalum TaxID=1806994 RepID=A0A507C789_9FUNG|nr:uncharacterized protein SmJEL517_g00749 [Synchytrium microbalum]TPX37440.1 hypothetical protein SmJEL517_g00749 [Synchytrium microbalum]
MSGLALKDSRPKTNKQQRSVPSKFTTRVDLLQVDEAEDEIDRSDKEIQRQRLIGGLNLPDATELGKENNGITYSFQRPSYGKMGLKMYATEAARLHQDTSNNNSNNSGDGTQPGGSAAGSRDADDEEMAPPDKYDDANEEEESKSDAEMEEEDDPSPLKRKRVEEVNQQTRERRIIARALKDDDADSNGESSDEDDDDGEEYEEQAEDEEEEVNEEVQTIGEAQKDAEQQQQSATGETAAFFKVATTAHITSNNTMAKLPSLEPKVYKELLSKVISRHAQQTKELAKLYESRYPEWYFSLSSGFNLLFYGYGSKRELLTRFAQRYCSRHPILVVNGYFPSTTIKDILGQILGSVVKYQGRMGTYTDQVNTIAEYFNNEEREYDRLYLLVHNIDGQNLRSEKAVSALALLASNPHIHVMASIDHIHAPMMWDSFKSHQFNWMYHDATTYEHYDAEMSFEDSILMKTGDDLSARGFGFVLQSVNESTRRLFKLLAETQIHAMKEDSRTRNEADDKAYDHDVAGHDHDEFPTLNNHMDTTASSSRRKGNGKASTGAGSKAVATSPLVNGIPFDTFWAKCRQQFIAHSIQTFRQLMTELKDHKLVLSKRRPDGQDALYIPLDRGSLEAVIEGM